MHREVRDMSETHTHTRACAARVDQEIVSLILDPHMQIHTHSYLKAAAGSYKPATGVGVKCFRLCIILSLQPTYSAFHYIQPTHVPYIPH